MDRSAAIRDMAGALQGLQNQCGQESKNAERYVRQGNVLPMATRTKISEVVFNERPVSIFLNNMYP